MRDAGEQQANGVGHRQPHRGEDSSGFVFDDAIDAGLNESVCGHALRCNAARVRLQCLADQPQADAVKIGVLMGSLLSAVVGVAVLLVAASVPPPSRLMSTT